MFECARQRGAGWAAAAALAAGVGLAAAPGARANVYGYYHNINDLLWGVSNMPDFDQRRAAASGIAGLPGDGSMYCVPTSTMNVMAYIARHGYPFVDPGISSWSSSSTAVYNDATSNLLAMGLLMNTDPNDGTGGTGWLTGARLWVSPFFFDVYTRFATNGQNVTTRKIAKCGLNGGLVSICYGRWDHSGSVVLTERHGGHCVTPVRIQTTGSLLSDLQYRDPATGGSLYSQSEFATTTQHMVDNIYFYNGFPVVMSKMDLDPAPSDGRFRIIDGLLVVYPKMGLTNWPQGSLTLTTPNAFDPDLTSIVVNAIGGTVLGVAQAPSRDFWAYIGEGDGTVGPGLYQVDPLTRGVRRVGDVPLPGGLVTGRDERVYVLDRDRIKCYRPNDEDQLEFEVDIPIPSPHGGAGGGIAFADMTDEIVVLSVGSRSILRYPHGSDLPAVQSLPGTIPLTGLACMQVDPMDGSLWMMADGSVRQIITDPTTGRLAPGMIYTPPAGEELRGFSMDSNDHLFVNLGGMVSEMQYVVGAGFQPVADSPFNGMPAGDCLQMSLSRTNYDTSVHSDPGWNVNIPAVDAPDGVSVPDCPADWNLDGGVDVFDLLDYLAEWFDQTYDADLNADGTVDVFDLLDYLTLWFRGC